ncbi:MAG: hypothetical protein KDA85_19105, partial [Planctomycetaceae bacterium]|nr:hypothetical protein [Planctomycetaceae bacterium]
MAKRNHSPSKVNRVPQAADKHTSPLPASNVLRRFACLLGLAFFPFLASMLFSMGEIHLPTLSIAEPRNSLVFDEYLLSYGEQPIAPRPLL